MKLLGPLLKRPLFTVVDAAHRGISRQILAYFVKKGILARICAGTYQAADYEAESPLQWENLALVAETIPKGVICLISALCYYDLTDQIMREVWIAVPHNTRPPKRPLTRIVRMRNMKLGQTEIMLGEHRVHIFDRERCIVDAFRYLSKEIAIKALRAYLRGTKYKPQLRKLGTYAKALRVDITPYILAYTT